MYEEPRLRRSFDDNHQTTEQKYQPEYEYMPEYHPEIQPKTCKNNKLDSVSVSSMHKPLFQIFSKIRRPDNFKTGRFQRISLTFKERKNYVF